MSFILRESDLRSWERMAMKYLRGERPDPPEPFTTRDTLTLVRAYFRLLKLQQRTAKTTPATEQKES